MRSIITTTTCIAALAALGLVGTGCGGSAPPTYTTTTYTTRTVAIDDVRGLERIASRQMACPVGALSSRQLNERVWLVSGCGQTREFASVPSRGGLAWQAITPVGRYATNALRCPLDSLVVSAPSAGVRNVTGCGQRATYEMTCDVRSCGWSLVERQASPPRPSVIVTPPAGAIGTAPPPAGGPVVVVPRPHVVDPMVERTLRTGLDARRGAVLACSGRQPVGIHARWRGDGRVSISLDPPFAGTAVEQCVRQSLPSFQVTNGSSGEIVHLIR